MLSLLIGMRVHNSFKRVLTYWRPPPANILDITCGRKILWKSLKNHPLVSRLKDIPDNGYKVVYSDIRKGLGDYAHDIKKRPWPYPAGFDVIVYDPPYMVTPSGFQRSKAADKIQKYDQVEVSTTLEELEKQFISINAEAPRLLNEKGLILVKIMETSFKGKFIDHNTNITNALSNFDKLYTHVYQYNSKMYFPTKYRPLRCHGYYLLFRSKKGLVFSGDNDKEV